MQMKFYDERNLNGYRKFNEIFHMNIIGIHVRGKWQ